jgi:hypothetical protein
LGETAKFCSLGIVSYSGTVGQFAAFSAFEVLKATWNAGDDDDPHVVELAAAVDNRKEAEDLPLAPWY